MTRDDIRRIIDTVPELNDFGIGVFDPRNKSPEQKARELADGKAELLCSVEACSKTCEWLRQVNTIKSMSVDSYGMKHMAERDIGYISNGVFITAAIHCGFPYRLVPGNPNVRFGMSKRSLGAIRARRTIKKG